MIRNDNTTSDNSKLKDNNILVLDDELDIITLLKTSLTSNGFNVAGFTNPFLALQHFQMNSKDYMLVISDIRMAAMNGFEFIRNIREIKLDVKVLLMTAVDINTTTFSEELLATKVNGFIQKPILLKELNTIVLKHIYISIKINKRKSTLKLFSK
jgi:DNA-binding NtrC family response regulator